jgi:hypothetical protein
VILEDREPGMSTDCKKPGVAFWATVVMVAVLVAYPLGAGPALWIAHQDIPIWCISVICFVYAPANWAEENAPEPVVRAIRAYLDWWTPKR